MLLRRVARRLRRDLCSAGLETTEGFRRAVEERLHPQHRQLRLVVRAGQGCGGFGYEFSTAAEGEEEGDWLLLCERDRVYLAVKAAHLPFLLGAVLDFEQGVQRTAFEVRANPNALSTCSCRKSFAPRPAALQAARDPAQPPAPRG